MLVGDATQCDFAAHHRACDEKSARLDAVGDDVVFRAVKFLYALDHDAAAASAFDFCAHLVEEIGEVHDFGLGRRTLDDCGALGEDGGHDDVVSAENGGALFTTEVHRRAAQCACKNFHISVLDAADSAKRLESFEVQINRSVTDDAAAGQGDGRFFFTTKQRAEHANAGAHFSHDFVGCDGFDFVRLHTHDAARALHVSAEVREDLQHVVDVRQVGDIGNGAGFAREKCGGENGQRAVLAAGDADAAIEAVASVNEYFIHE